MDTSLVAIPNERVERAIFLVRGQKVMLDEDLAALYRVPVKVLNQAVKRNHARFPSDFMFRLTTEEAAAMRSQIVTASKRNVRYRPYAFTEHGAVMLASVLNSSFAVQASVQVVRAFIRLRQFLATHKHLARKLEQMERKYDGQFKVVFETIGRLMTPPKAIVGRIGFRTTRKK